MIVFWNVRTYNGTESPQNDRFLQLEREFKACKLDILGLRGKLNLMHKKIIFMNFCQENYETFLKDHCIILKCIQ